MFKKLLVVLAISALFMSCSSNNTAKTELVKQLTVSELAVEAPNLLDQPVEVTGTVVHTCRHGGQKMFIIGDDPEQSFKITTGPNIAAFDQSLEGSQVVVNGVVKVQMVEEACSTEETAVEAETEEHTHQKAYYSIECTSFKEIPAEG